jgi:hypothetical protein
MLGSLTHVITVLMTDLNRHLALLDEHSEYQEAGDKRPLSGCRSLDCVGTGDTPAVLCTDETRSDKDGTIPDCQTMYYKEMPLAPVRSTERNH